MDALYVQTTHIIEPTTMATNTNQPKPMPSDFVCPKYGAMFNDEADWAIQVQNYRGN